MLQTNLIFGIQKKIKAGSKHAHKMGIVEESEVLVPDAKKATEPILESSFMAEMYSKSAKSKKKTETKNSLITESFQIHKVKKKLEKDIAYFDYLNENFVDEVFKDQYKELLESVLNDTVRLYQECDVTPRLVSQALDSNEINESQVIDIYKNRLNETIKNEYTKPMLSGKITEMFESEIRSLTTKLIQEGSDLEMEQVRVYMPFEETMYKFNKSILVPAIAETRVQAFMESMTPEYLDFIEESAEDILASIEKKIKLLTSMVSPNMFDASVEAEGVDAPKMAGISIAIDKNFDEPEAPCVDDICPDQVASSDPEAASEMADDEEAEETEADDIESAIDDNDNAYESEDSEHVPTIEMDTDDGAVDVGNVESGLAQNTSDVDLQGDGEDHGVDDGAQADLPGGASGTGDVLGDGAMGTEVDDSENPATPDYGIDGEPEAPIQDAQDAIEAEGEAEDAIDGESSDAVIAEKVLADDDEDVAASEDTDGDNKVDGMQKDEGVASLKVSPDDEDEGEELDAGLDVPVSDEEMADKEDVSEEDKAEDEDEDKEDK